MATDKTELWPLVESERAEIADFLGELSADQWSTPTGCDGWTVQEIAGHLTAGWNISLPKFMLGMIKHRGFDNFNRAAGKQLGARPSAEIIADLRNHVEHRFTPPGAGPEAPLSDLLIHGADIREALGVDPATPTKGLTIALDQLAVPQKGAPFPLKDTSGLHFVANDHSWESGSGALVEGTSQALLLGLSGRLPAIDQLTGDGIVLLRDRSS